MSARKLPAPPAKSGLVAAAQGATAAGTWTLVLPDPGCGFLNANQRRHWALTADAVRTWRHTAHWYALAADLPRLRRAHLRLTFHPATNGRRDIGNLYPTAKAVVDGLIDAALLPDDDDAHLLGPDLRPGAAVPAGRPVLVAVQITDLSSARTGATRP